MKKTIFALAIAAGLTSFAGNAKAQSYQFYDFNVPGASGYVDGDGVTSGGSRILGIDYFAASGVLDISGAYWDSNGSQHGFAYNDRYSQFSTFDVPGAYGTQIQNQSGFGFALYSGTYYDSSGSHGFVRNYSVTTAWNVYAERGYVNTVLNDYDYHLNIGESRLAVGSVQNRDGLKLGFVSSGVNTQLFTNLADQVAIKYPLAAAISTEITGITTLNSSTYIVGNYYDANLVSSGFICNLGADIFGRGAGVFPIKDSDFSTINVPSSFTYSNVPDAYSLFINGINGNAIYGHYIDLNAGGDHGFIDINGVFTTIDNPLGNATEVTGYANGTIFGNYQIYDANEGSTYHPFTTTPYAQAIPEPSTYALFGIGAIGLLMVLRSKKTA